MENDINDKLTKENNEDEQEIRRNENLVMYVDKFLYYEEVILGIIFKRMDLTMLYISDFSIYHKEL